MLSVNDVGEPCAGEPHARFDGRGLETEHQRCHRASPRPYTLGIYWPANKLSKFGWVRGGQLTGEVVADKREGLILIPWPLLQ